MRKKNDERQEMEKNLKKNNGKGKKISDKKKRKKKTIHREIMERSKEGGIFCCVWRWYF